MNIEESIKEMKSLSPSEEAIETLLTAYEKEKEKNKEHKEKIIYWLDRLDLEEALQNEYDELDGCQAAVKILKQLLKEK